jgi:small redox-active disulfide protein 2
MHIKILGSGCRNCTNLEANTTAALARLGIDATIDHVRNEADIIAYGIMSTPALVIDDRVVLAGRVASTDQIAQIITDAHAA